MACCTVSVVTEKGTVDTTFFRKSVSTFSARLTEDCSKARWNCAVVFPGRILLLIRLKILIILRYVIVNR